MPNVPKVYQTKMSNQIINKENETYRRAPSIFRRKLAWCGRNRTHQVSFLTILIFIFSISPIITSAGTINKTPSALGLTSGLVGYWTFDGADTIWTSDTVGTTTDKSGNNNNGGLINMNKKTSPAFGKIGQAMKFDGVDDFVNVDYASLDFTDNLSISLWVKLNSNSDGTLFDNGVFWNGYSLRVVSGKIVAYEYSGGWTSVTSIATINTESWYYITMTRVNGGKLTVYINGQYDNSGNSSETITYGTVKATIGAGWWQSNNRYDGFINGFLDDVRIYNRVLSADEVRRLYYISSGSYINKSQTASTTPSTVSSLSSGLVGHWTFDGPDTAWSSDTAGTVIDKSGNGNTGTLTSMNRKTSPTLGKIGQGLKFDGEDDYAVTSASTLVNPNTSDLTLSLWTKVVNFNLEGGGVSQRIFMQNIDGNNVWMMTMNDGATGNPGSKQFAFAIQKNGTGYYKNTTTSTWSTNVWYHIVEVWHYNTNTQEIYVDGVSQALNTLSSSAFGLGSADNKVYVGQRSDNNGHFNGSLDDVRVYNRALSATEVKQLYNMGR